MNKSPRTDELDALVFGVMAGKGGVGKTTIACNLARVISWSVPVLVVDLDLYNRGASALLVDDGIQQNHDTVYSLLVDAAKGTSDSQPARGPHEELNWRQIDERLQRLNLATVKPKKNATGYYLLPSSVTGDPIERLEYRFSIPATREFLRRILRAVVEKFQIRCIIFDCKAGPDPLALAVVGTVTETLLVSEYNPVTFDGTLNFHQHVRKEYGSGEQIGSLSVIVNKVPEKFDLTRVDIMTDLSRRLRPLYLLEAVPFEYDVFQAFGDYKFVVDDLPETKFSARMARLAEHLLERSQVTLHAQAREMARRAVRGGYRGVQARRQRVAQLVVLLGIILLLAGTSMLVGHHMVQIAREIAQAGIGSVTGNFAPLAAIFAAVAGLAAVIFGFLSWK